MLMGAWASLLAAEEQAPAKNAYAVWSNGPPAGSDYFPIAVWLQDPKNAPRYKAAGINLYVGLWKGPTEGQLAALKAAGMSVICELNGVGLAHKDDKTIVGWMHGDEPDNAQSLGKDKGYGPPIGPRKVIADYERTRAADPSRPVLLNLGQGVAFDGWIGRGVRTGHSEDYLEYVKGGDIVSFDIYPVVHDRPQVTGKLWYVPLGVQRLREWTRGEKIVWNCIECTHIGNPNAKATPKQVRAEVWMSIIRGSMGIIYFVHQFKPRFVEAALLDDAEMLRAVTAINAQIRQLAPVLNSPTLRDLATAAASNAASQVCLMAKRHRGATYLFAANLREAQTAVAFRVQGAGLAAEVLGEDRKITIEGGAFQDKFDAYDVRIYRIQ